ncbi:RagB/SusD family nutrient uptake outer membrane protein [Mucilaginibacter sp. AW1-3]
MKLNKYKIGTLALTAAFAFITSSCRKQLFQDPVNSLSPSSAFASADRAEKASVGMYDQLQNLNFFGGRVLIYVDCRGIDMNPPSYFAPLPTFVNETASETYTGQAWAGAYRTIGEANLFLANVAGASGVPAAKIDQYTGEAKFIRSLCYFYLVNMWAQPYNFTAGATHPGVPLVLTSSSSPFDPSNAVPRATVAAVYNQMEADLLDAEAKLPLNYGDPAFSNVARATKGAARGLLARLYLYKGDYAKANTYADKIINTAAPDNYVLNNDPLTAFRTFTTRESIFSVAMNGADNPNTNNALGQHYNPTKRGDIQLSSDFIGLMDITKDLRYKNLVLPSGTAYYSNKYLNTNDWVPVLRYAEILLIKAEALANLNATAVADPVATSLVNEVRARSQASAIAPVTKADQIAAILTERRIELAFEGQAEFDFLRTGRGIPAHGAATAQAYGSNYVVLAIPKYDTDKNPNLVQNPGY